MAVNTILSGQIHQIGSDQGRQNQDKMQCVTRLVSATSIEGGILKGNNQTCFIVQTGISLDEAVASPR